MSDEVLKEEQKKEEAKVTFSDDQQAALDKLIGERITRAKQIAQSEKETAVKEALKKYEGVDVDTYRAWQEEQSKQKQSEKSEAEKLMEKKLAELERKLTEEAQEKESYRSTLKQRDLESAARTVFTESGIRPDKIDDLLVLAGIRQAKKLFDLTDTGAIVGFDADGSMSALDPKDILLSQVKKIRPDYFTGSTASGGGAQGGGGYVPGQKTVTLDQLNAMKPKDRAEFFTKGGTIQG